MAVLLLTLKIIGITLLVILGILLLLILVILFVPFRYKIDAVIPEDDIKQSNVSAYMRYMHLIRVWVTYKEKDFGYKVKILFFKLNLDKYKDSSDNLRKDDIPNKDDNKEDFKEVKDKLPSKAYEDLNKDKKKKAKKKKKKKVKKDLKGKFKKLWKEIKFYYKMLKDEHNKDAFKYCLNRVKILLKHYMPRKAKGYVNFGLTDPSNTGLITGFLSLFPFMYTGEFKVYPDFCFDKNYINGEIQIKGHLRLVHLLTGFVLVYFNRDVRRFRKLMKRHKQGGIDNVRE